MDFIHYLIRSTKAMLMAMGVALLSYLSLIYLGMPSRYALFNAIIYATVFLPWVYRYYTTPVKEYY